MKSFYFLLFITNSLLICQNLQAQVIEWQRTIGGTGSEEIRGMAATSDGGFIAGGISASNTSNHKTEDCIGGFDYWIVKMDAHGVIEWENTIGGNNQDWFKLILQTTDGGYLLAGTSRSDISGDKTENCLGYVSEGDYWIVKTDDTGNIEWQNTIGGDKDDLLNSVCQTADGGYLLAGTSASNISGDKTEGTVGNNDLDYWIVKVDSDGNIEWDKTIGGTGNDRLNAAIQTSDGGYILGGYSLSTASGDKTENNVGYTDYWIVKTDSEGEIEWDETIGGAMDDQLVSIIQTDDDGYVLGGMSTSGISGDKTENNVGLEDHWIIKIDDTGNIEWQNSIGGNARDWLYSMEKTSDGGYVIAAQSESNASGDKSENGRGALDYWVVKINGNGEVIWDKTIGGSTTDYMYSAIQLTDGRYVLGGSSFSNISGDKTENSLGTTDYWVVKINPDNIISVNEPSKKSLFQIYPNPATNNITLSNIERGSTITIHDITGKLFHQSIINDVQTTIDTKQLSSGMYTVQVKNDNKSSTQKLVIE